ncbi:hypothetical protein D3C87_1780190 [compost metagenome]
MGTVCFRIYIQVQGDDTVAGILIRNSILNAIYRSSIADTVKGITAAFAHRYIAGARQVWINDDGHGGTARTLSVAHRSKGVGCCSHIVYGRRPCSGYSVSRCGS